jgi:hypothetical protein
LEGFSYEPVERGDIYPRLRNFSLRFNYSVSAVMTVIGWIFSLSYPLMSSPHGFMVTENKCSNLCWVAGRYFRRSLRHSLCTDLFGPKHYVTPPRVTRSNRDKGASCLYVRMFCCVTLVEKMLLNGNAFEFLYNLH